MTSVPESRSMLSVISFRTAFGIIQKAEKASLLVLDIFFMSGLF